MTVGNARTNARLTIKTQTSSGTGKFPAKIKILKWTIMVNRDKRMLDIFLKWIKSRLNNNWYSPDGIDLESLSL